MKNCFHGLQNPLWFIKLGFVILNGTPRFFFSHSEREFLFFYHSERAFGRGRIPSGSGRDKVVKLMADFIYDSSNEHARFFTAFRMTCREDFLQ